MPGNQNKDWLIFFQAESFNDFGQGAVICNQYLKLLVAQALDAYAESWGLTSAILSWALQQREGGQYTAVWWNEMKIIFI